MHRRGGGWGHKDTCTRTLRWMQTHTALAEGLERFLPLCLFSSAVTLLPWRVIKKCHRFWRSDFRRALPQNGQRGRWGGGVRNDELVLDHACKLNPGGGSQSLLLWHDGSSQLYLSASSPLPGSLFQSHMGRRFDLDQELSHASSVVSVCWGPNRWIRLEQSGGELSPSSALHFPSSLSLFSINARPISAFKSRSVSFSCSIFPLSLQRQGDPCAQS